MTIQKISLFILFISLNVYAQDSCSELSQDECVLSSECEINYDASGQFEGCVGIEDDGPPECILDCVGIEDIVSDDPYQLCEWIISFNGTDCTNDCDEELLFTFEYMANACYDCLSDSDIDCSEIFEDDDNSDDGEGEEDDGPPECTYDCPGVFDINGDNYDEICDWIISINGTECMQDCDEGTMILFEYLSGSCYNCCLLYTSPSPRDS